MSFKTLKGLAQRRLKDGPADKRQQRTRSRASLAAQVHPVEVLADDEAAVALVGGRIVRLVARVVVPVCVCVCVHAARRLRGN